VEVSRYELVVKWDIKSNMPCQQIRARSKIGFFLLHVALFVSFEGI
jgi:hypothetical protein